MLVDPKTGRRGDAHYQPFDYYVSLYMITTYAGKCGARGSIWDQVSAYTIDVDYQAHTLRAALMWIDSAELHGGQLTAR